MVSATIASGSPPRHSLWPAAVMLGATIAGLWLLLAYPPVVEWSAPFNVLTAEVTARLLAVFGLPVAQELTVLRHAGGFACEIDTACTALVPAGLLSAALLAWRRSWTARLAGVGVGILWLTLFNQLRLMSLVWLGVYAPVWFDPIHLWLWPALLVLAAAGYGHVWLRWAR
jgi:exosortase/archaeosortase family protein